MPTRTQQTSVRERRTRARTRRQEGALALAQRTGRTSGRLAPAATEFCWQRHSRHLRHPRFSEWHSWPSRNLPPQMRHKHKTPPIRAKVSSCFRVPSVHCFLMRGFYHIVTEKTTSKCRREAASSQLRESWSRRQGRPTHPRPDHILRQTSCPSPPLARRRTP